MTPTDQGLPFHWLAADLARGQHWWFEASPDLAGADRNRLRHWSGPLIQELRRGTGVALVKGLADLSETQLRSLYLAIGECIGEVETTYGSLYDVTDSGASHLDAPIPVSQTRAATTVHTDSSRLETHPRWVGLACIRQAPRGGGSRIVSAVAVHEHLAIHHPAQLLRLRRCFHRDVVTPNSRNDLSLVEANCFPVFSMASDGPSLRYMRYWIEKAHERLNKPLHREDLEAFDVLDQTLNAPLFRHDLKLEPGDILFIDNHKIAHDRDSYEDNPRAPRLMVRLWLEDRQSSRAVKGLDTAPHDHR